MMSVVTPPGPALLLHTLAYCVAAAVAVGAAGGQNDEKETKKPSLTVRVAPPIVFSPARVVVTAELKGGALDDPLLYCPQMEWDWGDGTKSEATENCEPYEEGKSTVKRRWTTSHTYDMAGQYRVQLRLKRGSKTIVAGNNMVQVKPGVRDMSSPY
jgi:hypothetical protein